jgi:hypothetical protein
MFKKYDQHIEETFAYEGDPLKEGDAIFVKKVKIEGSSIIQIVGQVDGIRGMHTALISIRTKSLDAFGEDSLKQRIIIHQKDFTTREEAVEYLNKKKEEIKFEG